MKDDRKPRRHVRIGQAAAIGGMALALGTTAIASSGGQGEVRHDEGEWNGFQIAQADGEGEGEGEGASTSGGEGEGEGGGADLGTEVNLLRDLGFMTGHMRAGLALYEEGDLEAAKTHMGHPIEEKYEAVAGALDTRGYGYLRDEIMAVVEAAESDAALADVQPLFDKAIATVEQVRDDAPAGPSEQMRALSALARIAADEYSVGVADDGTIENLHEYQDSWGFFRSIEAEARHFAESDDADVVAAGRELLAQVEATAPAYGDLQGRGIETPNPSLLYGAAARMEITALGLQS